MVEIFKTNISSKDMADSLLIKLGKELKFMKLNFDLNDCDNILRVEATFIDIARVLTILDSLDIEASVLE